ncbi:DUF1361 domain-containing protein [Williamsia limnetica]|nr:DUF1361 domain-containing protein [Williamsia limnetica]
MPSIHVTVLILALLATTGLTVALGITDPHDPSNYPSKFLIWNLFLAWIPLLFALGFSIVRSRWLLAVLGVGWLAFLPNAPYLITDLVHLREGYELWRHVLQYGFAAWTGIMLGVVSMLLVHRRTNREAGSVAGWAVVGFLRARLRDGVGAEHGRGYRAGSNGARTRPGMNVPSTRYARATVRRTMLMTAVCSFRSYRDHRCRQV